MRQPSPTEGAASPAVSKAARQGTSLSRRAAAHLSDDGGSTSRRFQTLRLSRRSRRQPEARVKWASPPSRSSMRRKPSPRSRRRRGWSCVRVRDFVPTLHHVEVALGRAAFGTNPVVWNIGPPGARSQAFVRCAGCFVIDVAASPALPGFVGLVVHFDSRSCMARGRDVSRV